MEKVRLDKYLSEVLGVSRAQIAHLIDKKMVLVNGAVAKKSEIVGKGDDIKIAESSAGNSPLGLHSADLANFGEQQTQSLVVSPKFTTHRVAKQKNHESQTENPSVVDSVRNAQNLDNLNPCEAPENSPASWCKKSDSRLQKCNRRFFARSGESEALPLKAKSGSFWRVGGVRGGVQPFCEKESELSGENSVRVAESSLDSTDSQNLPQIQRLYEDDDILVLNKPPFLATHGAPSLKEPSLVEWLKAHKIQCSTISGELREGIVHRLDKQTSGALVVAKNNDAHNALSAQLADKTMGRLYLAIIDLPLKEDIEIECYLARNPKNRLKISKVDMRKYKKSAESSLDSAQPKFARYSKSKFYKLLPSKDGKKELILAKLFTGRTHQIRAHLESINRHIVGDELYGYKRGKGEGERVMLHAYLLELTHPNNNFCALNSSLGTPCGDLADFGHCADSSLALRPKSAKNSTTSTANTRICDFKSVDSARGAEFSEKIKSKKPFKSFCYFWLLPKVESPLSFNYNLPNNADSANPKLRFIAPLFDDMKYYLAKNFDMEKVYEILHTLPTRAF